MISHRTILAIASLIPTLTSGQIKIMADTISKDCEYLAWSKTDKIIIDSQEKYDQSKFTKSYSGSCVSFDQVDFDRSILVGFKYLGSNCDDGIQWATLI